MIPARMARETSEKILQNKEDLINIDEILKEVEDLVISAAEKGLFQINYSFDIKKYSNEVFMKFYSKLSKLQYLISLDTSRPSDVNKINYKIYW